MASRHKTPVAIPSQIHYKNGSTSIFSMAESPEVPEAKDPFEKKIALSIAIVAVMLALIGAKGDHAKTEAIIKRAEASDQWAFFQSKSVKQHISEVDVQLAEIKRDLKSLKPAAPEGEKKVEKPEKSPKGPEAYEKEKEEIKEKAEDLEKESNHELALENKLHLAEVLLQLAVVLSSIAILTRWHLPWFVGMALAAAGAIYGAINYF
jgi:hypothetical protein